MTHRKDEDPVIEEGRKKFEGIASQVGCTRFERCPKTGEYLDHGVSMDWRIFQVTLRR